MKAPFPSSASLASLLQSDAPVLDKAVACQQLAIVGGADAVPALASLLEHEHLSDYARSALENIPAPEASDALLKALPGLKGVLLHGVIDSLGVRRESAAVPALLALLEQATPATRDAVFSSLGKIATPEAIAALTRDVSTAAHPLLLHATVLIRDGRHGEALPLLEAILTSQAPQPVRSAAARLKKTAESVRLFDGTTLRGWEGDLTWFRIQDGAIVAGSLQKDIPQNEFLVSEKTFSDFELRLKVRLPGNKGNGGIQFRSRRIPGGREMEGYQADVADGYWGGLYDESRRRAFLGNPPDATRIGRILKPDDWNAYKIRCEGPRVRLWLNGELTTDFTETDPGIPRSGKIGLQIHAGPPIEVFYKDIELTEL